MLGQQFGNLFGLPQCAHKGHHDLHIGETHVIAHTFQSLAFHRKGFAKIGTDIARRATETQHRIFFFRLVAATANEFAVFVGFEIAQTHNHRLGPERSRNGGHAFSHFVHIESTR